MIIKDVYLQNFRTIEKLNVSLPSYYCAISGRNNSGKTNLIRALRYLLIGEEDILFTVDENELKYEVDYPKWKTKESHEAIKIGIKILLDNKSDESLLKFIEKFTIAKRGRSKSKKDKYSELEIYLELIKGNKEQSLEMFFNGKEVQEEFNRKEIIQKLRSSNCLIFHNSTDAEIRTKLWVRRTMDYYDILSQDDKKVILKKKEELFKLLKGSLKKRQKELTDLLCRLEEKFEVGLSLPNVGLERQRPIISLGEKGIEIPLQEWGSGTKNRTYILMILLNIKRLMESEDALSKITPVLVLEEPESFLHPSAQAEFGRLLQILAEELKIQVMVTTHSPYLLSHRNPESNILFKRKIVANSKIRETEIVPIDSKNWYEPFEFALGIHDTEIKGFKGAFFSNSQNLLLVEGDIDREYFEMLRDKEHGNNQLVFEGEIFPYDGVDALKNPVLLKFIKERFTKFIVTVDLDRYNEVKKTFETLGMIENVHYLSVGLDKDGKRDIEGLLPEPITSKVYANNASIVSIAMGSGSDKNSAKQKLKRLLLEEFKKISQPGDVNYKQFYVLVKKINRALNSIVAVSS